MRPRWPRRDVVLVVSVREYLHRPLVDLARHLHGAETRVIAVRAWPGISKWFLLALFLWYLPFRVTRVLTPSDLGGRLVRMILDAAALLDVEACVVPAHNHPFALDPPLPWRRRYLDLSRPRVVGGFARRARILVNDEPMREFFLALGYDQHRLLTVPDWIGTLYRREEAPRYGVVFFSEVIQEIDRRLFALNLARVRQLSRGGCLPRLHVKLHPREPADAVAAYRDELPGVEFLDAGTPSMEVVARSAVVIASFSTVLLEALWLGKRIVVLDNEVARDTMLAGYLRVRDHLVYRDERDDDALTSYCAAEADLVAAR